MKIERGGKPDDSVLSHLIFAFFIYEYAILLVHSVQRLPQILTAEAGRR